MRKLITFIISLSMAMPLAAQTGPKMGKNGGVGSASSVFVSGEPSGGTYAINGTTGDAALNKTALKAGPSSLINLNGENISLFNIFPAYGWEKRDGTRDAPLTVPGPSLKISRVEKLTPAQCNNTFNENSCNAAIYGSVSQDYSGLSSMQTTGVLGTSLIYATNNDGEGVGVQGISRAVGSSIAGIAGGYFEARYDSTATRSYHFTIGVEARTNNLTGTDAPLAYQGGNNYIPLLASCGGGPSAPAMKCWSFFFGGKEQAQAYYGYTLGDGAASLAGFYDRSSAVDSIRIDTGTHTSLINADAYGFNISGAGKVWVGPGYDSATTTGLTVKQANSSQAYFGSTGANDSFVNVDSGSTGRKACVQLDSASVAKWQICKETDDSFFVYDSAGSRKILATTSGGGLLLGAGQSTSANITVDAMGGLNLTKLTVATLPTCNSSSRGVLYEVTDATAPAWHATLAGSGAVFSGAMCNGSNWIAF